MIKQLEESVQATYQRKMEEPRTVLEWSMSDFKNANYEFIDFPDD